MKWLIPDIDKIVLKNAITHEGKAEVGSVVNKLIGTYPEMKSKIREIMPEVKENVERINLLSLERQMEIARELYPEILQEEHREKEKRLADLKNVHGKVVMRLAPSPSGPLHLGHTRMCILNDEYVKRYGGELILRIEDTNPNNILPEAYEMIKEDCRWLGVNYTQLIIQSERMEIYYQRARDLISQGYAYMCTCRVEDFKRDLMNSTACPHRNTTPEENIRLFDLTAGNDPMEQHPVLVIKTDLHHPNPAIRDWIAFRIIEGTHPHTGNKYRFYPLMNFSVAVDDHELGLTHVIRGTDHINNTERQKYIFKYLGWTLPEYFHYGMIRIEDTVLKKTLMKKGITSGEFTGWDDVRLSTIMSLAKRGYQPETFRKYWIDSGLNETNADFSWDIFNSINRQFIDKSADRYFFVSSPVEIKINGAPNATAKLNLYPNEDSRGFRKYDLENDPVLYIQESDLKDIADGEVFRLKGLYNVQRNGDSFTYAGSEVHGEKKRIIHWVGEHSSKFTVLKPDGTEDHGLLESEAVDKIGIIQLERYSFVNKVSESRALFLHR